MKFTKNRKFKWGIIGSGHIATAFIQDVKQISNQEVVATSSKSLARAKKLKQQFKLPACFSNYETMLKTADIDGIYVATSHNYHLENVLLALRYNKHVLCEKTCFLNVEEFDIAIKEARKRKLLFMEALWSRFLPIVTRLDEIIKNKTIGDVMYSQATFCLDLAHKKNPNTSRLLSLELGGGAMLDLGIYCLTFLDIAFSAKKIKNITSTIVKAESGVDLLTSACLDYGNAKGEMLTSFLHKEDNKQIIVGDKGVIFIPDLPHPSFLEIRYKNGKTEKIRLAHKHFCHEITSFVQSIEKGEKENSIMPLKTSRRILSIIDKILQDNKIYYSSAKK